MVWFALSHILFMSIPLELLCQYLADGALASICVCKLYSFFDWVSFKMKMSTKWVKSNMYTQEPS